MSLINQMLRDLDARREFNPNPIDRILQDLAPSLSSTLSVPRLPWQVGLIAGLILCAVLSGLVAGIDLVRHHLRVATSPESALPLPAMPRVVAPQPPAPVIVTQAVAPVSKPKPPPAMAAAVTRELRAVAEAIEALPTSVAPAVATPRRVASHALEETTGSFHREPAQARVPGNAELELTRATTLIANGNTVRGLGSLQAYLADHPAEDSARIKLAETLLKLDRQTGAVSVLREGLNVQPQSATLARMLGHLLFDRGEVPAALQVMRAVRPAVASDPEYYAFLAALYQRLGSHAAAAATYREILSVQPISGTAWIGLGISLAATGDNAEARQAFAQAARDPRLSTVMREYATREIARMGAP